MKLKRVVCVVRHGARTPLVDGSSPVLGLTEWKPEVCIRRTCSPSEQRTVEMKDCFR